jgi:hypothetical protein
MRKYVLRLIFEVLGLHATFFCGGSAWAGSEVSATGKVEPARELVCRLIETSAQTQNLPVPFLTRLIWQESSFRSDAVSPAGAQGIAQFMPRTAGERGLAKPFDAEEAIPRAAELLASLKRRFGNLGLAAAAYNAGPARVSDWLAGQGYLPSETRNYVLTITRRPVEDWRSEATAAATTDDASPAQSSCLQVIAAIRRSQPDNLGSSAIVAPWGVQFAGSHSKPAVIAAYARAQHTYPSILGSIEPILLSGRVAGFGIAPYHQIRAPAASRAAADALCDKILRAGGSCTVLRN